MDIPDKPEELFQKTGNLPNGKVRRLHASAGIGVSFCAPSANFGCAEGDCDERALGGVVGTNRRTGEPLTVAKCLVHLMAEIMECAKLVVETVYHEEFLI